MNLNNKLIAIIVVSSILLISCTSTNAIYSEKKPSGYNVKSKNKVIEYKDPQYETAMHPGVWGTLLLGGAAGFVLGGGIDYYRQWGELKINWLTVGLGIMATALVISELKPKPEFYKIRVSQEQMWLDDSNDRMRENYEIVLRFERNSQHISNIFLVPESSENAFVMEDLDDAFLFSSAFPASTNLESLLINSMGNFQRDELPELIDLFKYDSVNLSVKLQFLNRGITILDFIDAYKKYPVIEIEAEKKVAEKASNISDYILYLSNFPTGASVDDIRRKLAKAIEEKSK